MPGVPEVSTWVGPLVGFGLVVGLCGVVLPPILLVESLP